ncbi:hypothetical protein ILUMI_00526 [Ignelater luminosus]|uniref:Reverse transcriptase Ty1/copia-type domain-containing protein n=1 Tax=Ignelater luminosus TaxID=2038154 RepID=A0A8K0DGA1_IGNLU|nr:hypothetical protein ILUMI_00526 [Ignelater luminosus]
MDKISRITFALKASTQLDMASNQVPPKYSHRELFEVWRNEVDNEKKTTCVYMYIAQKLNLDNCDEFVSSIKKQSDNFCAYLKMKWTQAYRCKETFYKKNQTWLDRDFVINNASQVEPLPSISKEPGNVTIGRPKKLFRESSNKTKTRRMASIIAQHSPKELSFATETCLQSQGKQDAATMMAEIVSSSTRATKVKQAYKRKQNDLPQRINNEQVLPSFVDNRMTKKQYIRLLSKEHNANIYPTYKDILQTKEQCYPSEIIVSEKCAEVELQSLIDHTITRLVSVQYDVIKQSLETMDISALPILVIFKWGCDGSSGHSRWTEEHDTHDDSYISSESEYLDGEDDNLQEEAKNIPAKAECLQTDDLPQAPQPVYEEKVKRQRKKPSRCGIANICARSIGEDELTYAEAISGPEKQHWLQAMAEELQSFEDNQVWEIVDAPDSASVVQCKWVLKKKFDCDDKVRYRASLVAKSFTQKAGVDYQETFSLVIRQSTLRLLFALSVQLDTDITHLDVTTAFLNGCLKESIFMHLPEDFPVQDSTKGQVKQYLGMIINIDKSSNVITVDQEHYIEQLLKKFDMSDCNMANTPIECKLNVEKSNICEDKLPYQELMGSLMYLAVLTRSDIAYSVSYLSQFDNCYSYTHWNYAKKILKYLSKTKHYCLRYSKKKEQNWKDMQMRTGLVMPLIDVPALGFALLNPGLLFLGKVRSKDQ